MALEDIASLAQTRARVDDKAVKKVINLYYKLLTTDLEREPLLAAHAALLSLLAQLETYYSKAIKLQSVTEREVQTYKNEVDQILISQQNTRETVLQLQEKLVDAQQARANKIEYEKIGKRIDRLPAREQGEIINQKLLSDIAQLREEQTTYAATWNSRREAFDSIVQGLTVMSESIRDEKLEQERRRALDDAEDDETPPAPAIATTSLPRAVVETTEVPPKTEDVNMDEVEEGEEREEPPRELEEGEMDTA